MALDRRSVFATDAHPASLLVRIAVGYTFLVAGTNKLRDIEAAGGNFAGIGFPVPTLAAGTVGSFEVLCGVLVIAGLATRLAAIPLMVIMLTAIISTKLPILVGGPVGPFSGPGGDDVGLMPFLRQARLDVTMLLSAAYLFWAGAGPISVDARIAPTHASRAG